MFEPDLDAVVEKLCPEPVIIQPAGSIQQKEPERKELPAPIVEPGDTTPSSTRTVAAPSVVKPPKLNDASLEGFIVKKLEPGEGMDFVKPHPATAARYSVSYLKGNQVVQSELFHKRPNPRILQTTATAHKCDAIAMHDRHSEEDKHWECHCGVWTEA